MTLVFKIFSVTSMLISIIFYYYQVRLFAIYDTVRVCVCVRHTNNYVHVDQMLYYATFCLMFLVIFFVHSFNCVRVHIVQKCEGTIGTVHADATHTCIMVTTVHVYVHVMYMYMDLFIHVIEKMFKQLFKCCVCDRLHVHVCKI